MDKIIYFELNNWIPGIFYPDDEPFRLLVLFVQSRKLTVMEILFF